MEERTIRDLEAERVLKEISSHSLSDDTEELISPSLFTDDISLISRRRDYIERILDILERGERPVPSHFPFIKDILDHVDKTHMSLSGEMLFRIGEYIESYLSVLEFLNEEINERDRLLKELSESIKEAIDERGEVKDTHRRIKPLIKNLERDRLIRENYSTGYIKEHIKSVQNDIPVYRNGRVLIQLKMSVSKKGIYVSGVSNTQETIYAEPFELVELNNRVLMAEEMIKSEKEKIIGELSNSFKSLYKAFLKIVEFSSDFDLHYSFSLHIKKNKWGRAEFSSYIDVRNLRHPLLGERAVGIDVLVNSSIRGVVFSGANGGGKTVSMKSIAILCFLSQIAGYGPADDGYKIPLYSQILTDIGDGQSIEDDASTFSSHMQNIAYICSKTDDKSLVLLDELGSSTDPEEGSALSLSILKWLMGHSSLILLTSHYRALKAYAYTNELLINASMSFDMSENRPLFKLIEGLSGESHAIEAAMRADMPLEIIESAREGMGVGEKSISSLLSSLEERERILRESEAKLNEERDKERELISSLEEEKERLDEEIRKLSSRAKSDVDSLISEKRSEIENLIISYGVKNNEEKEIIGKAKEKVGELEKISKDLKNRSKRKDRGIPHDLEIGDSIRYRSAEGKIIDGSGSTFLVLFDNGIKMRLNSEDLRKIEDKRVKPSVLYTPNKAAKAFIDVRGKTLEEAIKELDNQLESALVAGLREFYVIHGLGNGILMRGLHEHLKGVSFVKDYYFAREDDGGMGKTYVILDIN